MIFRILIPLDLTEDDVRDIINLVFCACDQGDHDGDLTLDEWMGPVCENVNDHLFGYQVSEDDFNNADANGDGVCTVDEVHDFAMSHADMRSLNREFYFSDDASIEAQVRLIGCACDNDGDYMLSLEEVNEEHCVILQHWLFDNNLDEESFEFVDANNDGLIDGDEAAAAMEMAEEEYTEGSEEDSKEDYDLTEDDVRDIINLVFCACDQGDHDGDLTLEEWMGPVCENVNDHLFGYQVSEDDFNAADANGDGVCTVDEVHDFAMSKAEMRSLNRELYFSDDASVEAQVRLIGCACDKDEDYMLSFEEVNEEHCVLLQHWLFGNNLDEESFEFVDANNDGLIDGDEAAAAMEMAEEEYTEYYG